MTAKISKHLQRLLFKNRTVLIWMAGFSIIGVVTLLTIKAATPSADYEAEAGNGSGNAKIVNNDTASNASNNGYIVFQAPTLPGVAGVFQNVTPSQSLLAGNIRGHDSYGTQTIKVAPSNPSTIYVGTCWMGLYKSTDKGLTWRQISTGTGASSINNGKLWTLAVDPTNENIVYTTPGEVGGLWKSVDGGVNWVDVLNSTILNATGPDVYSIDIDPSNHLHLIAGFHGGWRGGSQNDTGLIESLDGGTTWVAHAGPNGAGYGNYGLFINSTTWILATQGSGFFRTTNSGNSWSQVSTADMSHGGEQLYRASNGTIYMAALHGILRSTNSGASWTEVGPSNIGQAPGYYSIIGDGTTLYIHPGVAWSTGSWQYYTSLESDGITWKKYSNQNIDEGPMSMSYDPINKILYSSNWTGGIWRLQL